ncbi:hypothetical protein ACQKKX_06765 [Neorhizobium sp. NPDC001467]|uniref:hypothetical protein n=1 Tax=Neorhizobium sp. NPDC001467 TaxID=3390595 RepID=UPI003CFEB41A
MTAFDARCGLCRAHGIQETARTLDFGGVEKWFALECSHCGMLYEDLDAVAGSIEMANGEGVMACTKEQDFGCDIYTLRMLAARFGLAARPQSRDQEDALADPHSRLAGMATTIPLETLAPMPLTLGIMCRAHELDLALEKFKAIRQELAQCIIVLDRAADDWTEPATGFAELRVVCRPLNRQFHAQRNFIQDLSTTDWVLQLDLDESLDLLLLNRLRRLATLAQEQSLLSIGLPRRNFVDGTLSDLYPDVQYRLNHRSVRFEGVVHERPSRPWQRSMIAIGIDIDHHLEGTHVRRRSHRYDDILPGGGRKEEESILTTPFRA